MNTQHIFAKTAVAFDVICASTTVAISKEVTNKCIK